MLLARSNRPHHPLAETSMLQHPHKSAIRAIQTTMMTLLLSHIQPTARANPPPHEQDQRDNPNQTFDCSFTWGVIVPRAGKDACLHLIG
eukprot:6149463-Amphidinium_carterae.1